MRRAFLSLAIACGMFAAPVIASAAPLAERIAAFNATLTDTPCVTDAECEALAHSFGLDPVQLDAIVECENGDDAACDYVDENAN